MRIAIIALLTSFIAGVFAAGTLKLMVLLTDLIWHRPMAGTPLYILAACTLGGLLIGLTRHGNRDVQTLTEQIDAAIDPVQRKRTDIWLIALGAALAVGFGGALGPEAGLIAVVTELAALVSLLVARSAAEEREIGQASISAALAALYASPPGGAAIVHHEHTPGDWAEAKARSIAYLDFLAALAGVAGFWVTAQLIFSEGFHRIHLPHHTPPLDGTDILYSLLPGAMGALVGAAFLQARYHATRAVEARIASPVVQSTLGGFLFGLMAAALPILRFSGHHEFETMMEAAGSLGVLALVGLALAKALACTLCLSTGWRGGAIFPLIFAGGAMGYAAHFLQGSPNVAVAVAAGLAGATAAGLGRPMVALLILLFLVGTQTAIPIAVGIGFGMIAARFSPQITH
ncbi:chloride channel protein [Pseudoruegeria sp. SHC-113]|uniref:chloride channel protein n=1 Tax=Pseudoruegeria sp. SHC-113 TaxID=2855439 RepID=UPI0021BB5D13|nr:chloride channel protein [Pseudoruegeria sp. SHC-113]MCT8160063.1 chloride channel protein [Pseudoruegeria sp. SHC-113]